MVCFRQLNLQSLLPSFHPPILPSTSLKFQYQGHCSFTMLKRSGFVVLFLILCSLLSTLVSAVPATPSYEIDLVKPVYGNYTVGDILTAKAKITTAVRRANPLVKVIMQKKATLPLVNEHIGDIRARDLASKGFKVKLLKRWLIKEQGGQFRIRINWKAGEGFDGGFNDSEGFNFHE